MFVSIFGKSFDRIVNAAFTVGRTCKIFFFSYFKLALSVFLYHFSRCIVFSKKDHDATSKNCSILKEYVSFTFTVAIFITWNVSL